MTTTVVKHIGVGKEFATLADFRTWISAQDLVANNQMVYAYVYNDLDYTTVGFPSFALVSHSEKNFCIVQPAPGLGVNELFPNSPFDYGTAGIEIKIGIIGTNAKMWINSGTSYRNFRISITGAAPNDTSVYAGIQLGRNFGGSYGRVPELKFNRIKSSHTGASNRAIATGNYGVGGNITDNLIIQTAGNGLLISINNGSRIERNTLVRIGTAKGYPGTTGISDTIRDNIYLGCGPTPALGLPATANPLITNNYTDTVMTGNKTGFTVLAEGSIVESIESNYQLKNDAAVIGGASASSHKTKDMINSYRGTNADAGAYQRTSQPLPPLAVGRIVDQTILNQNVVFTGTIENEVMSGIAKIYKSGVLVAEKDVTINGSNFEVAFTFIPGGNYDAPEIIFSNPAGPGLPSLNATTFVIADPIIPTATITKQYIVGRKVTIVGTVSNAPKTGVANLLADSTPNGAVSPPQANVTINDNQFVVSFNLLAYGNYQAPSITFTNGAGTGAPATNGAAITIAAPIIPPVPGVSVHLIGTGEQHTTLQAFGEWLKTRNLVENSEIIHAYVLEDQTVGNISLRTPVNGAGPSNYVIVRPAPGMSVNDLNKGAPFNYGDVGIELNISLGSLGMLITPGVIVEGFRINIANVAGVSLRYGIMMSTQGWSNATGGWWPVLRNNRIRGVAEGISNALIFSGQNGTQARVYDNYIEQISGDAPIALASQGLFERNTFKHWNAPANYVALTYDSGINPIRDNIFIGCPIPISVTRSAAPIISNNVTDLTPPTAIPGIAVSSDVVVNPSSDFRPKADGAAINAASEYAKSTNDIVGHNRGPQPDIGAWQLNPFIPTPVAVITSQTVDGTTVTLSGTVNNEAQSGIASMAIDTGNPDGASEIGQTPVILDVDTGNWSVTWTGVSAGNYTTPVVIFTNAGGVGSPAIGGMPVTIISIGGNPTAPENEGPVEERPPELTITNVSLKNRELTLAGKVNLQNDPDGKIEVYFDSIPSGTTEGPFLATINNGEDWQFVGTTNLYRYTARVVATAFGIPDIATEGLAVLRVSNTIALPLK